MKVAVISDLHIGHSDETHQLGHADYSFAEFLFFLEKTYDKIILLGDIFEIEMENELNPEVTYDLCKQEHNLITKRFEKPKYVYVFGNHDLIGEKFGAIEKYEISYMGNKYLFIHGHQFDHFYQSTSSTLAYFGGLCLKLNMKSLYRWVTEKFELGAIFSIKRENEKFEKKAISYANKHGYKAVITGHTHNPKILESNGNATFMNSGTCTHGRFCYLHLDLENSVFELKEERPV